MNIDKYKQAENEFGGYKDPTGCCWEDAESFLHGYVLDFCCCGSPETNLKYIASVLEHINNQQEQLWTDKISYEDWVEQGKKIGNEQQLYFVYYFLDSKELTEHGDTVTWSTERKEVAF